MTTARIISEFRANFRRTPALAELVRQHLARGRTLEELERAYAEAVRLVGWSGDAAPSWEEVEAQRARGVEGLRPVEYRPAVPPDDPFYQHGGWQITLRPPLGGRR